MSLIEIERKFLVKNNIFKTEAFEAAKLIQGYLNSNPHRTVRIRIKDEKGFLTIKGIPDAEGLVRFEWEKEISYAEAISLIKLCEPGVIEKIRYLIKAGEHTYEVDEFLEENKGLIVAEIELNDPMESFSKPDWLGEEVTGDMRYYNSQLSKNPYKSW